MKKLLKSLLYTAMALLLTLSCQQELPMPESTEPYFATIVEEDATKVGIDEACELYWHANDEISIFLGTTGQKYTFSGADGDKQGTFVAETAASGSFDKAFALYPYSEDAACSAKGAISVDIPAVQHYTAGGFDPAANIMVAATSGVDDHNLQFKNVCGYIRLKIYGQGSVKSITLSGLGDETLAGAATVTASADKEPSIKLTGSDTSITLDCGEGVALSDSEDSATDFWLAVPPVKFAGGFRLEITMADGKSIVKETVSEFKVKRNIINTINAFRVAVKNMTFVKFGVLDNAGNFYPAHDLLGPYITICVPRSTDRTALIPVFEFNGSNVTLNKRTVTSGSTTVNFKSNQAAPLVIKGDGKNDKVYYVRVIDTDLPTVFVSTPGHAGIVDTENWIKPSTIFISSPEGEITDLGLTSIRGRGNNSWHSAPKKGYNLKLDSKQPVLGLKKHKRWRLMAGWYGITNNDFYLELGRRTSIGWSPRGNYVELVLNGEWIGNYWLCEHMSVDKNRLDIAEMKATDLTEPEITGGYLLEFDSYFDEEPKFRTQYFNLPVMVSSHDEDSPVEQIRWIEGYINNLEASLKDEARLAACEYMDYIDVDSFCDWFFLAELAEKRDMRVPLSVYMHKDRGGKLAMGPVWDFEFIFKKKSIDGGLTDKTDPQNGTADDNGWYMTYSLYYSALLKSPEFKAALKARWPVFKASVEQMPAYLEEIAGQINFSATRDYSFWKSNYDILKYTGRSFSSFSDETSNITETFQYNLQWIDSHLDELVNR